MKYNKIALVFPGQGSQFEGMGKELHSISPVVQRVYSEASNILGYDVAKVCFDKHRSREFMDKLNAAIENYFGIKQCFNTKAQIDQTIYTQPAVLTTSFACYKALEERCKQNSFKLEPSFVMGHSLGEYTALVASGAMEFEAALKLVDQRAHFMLEAGNISKGGLMVIMETSKYKELKPAEIRGAAHRHNTYIALINSPRSIVVGGPKKGLDKLAKALKSEGKRTIPLGLDGPFHTPWMTAASLMLKGELAETIDEKGENYAYPIITASVPIIANVDGNIIKKPEDIQRELHLQMRRPVDWRGSVETAVANGVDLFIEFGPKTIMSMFINDTLRYLKHDIPIFSVADPASLEKTVTDLTG